MLEAIGAAPGSSSEVDWHQTWRSSLEYQATQGELARLSSLDTTLLSTDEKNISDSYKEFAAPLWKQFLVVTQRVFQQSWRTPSYIYSKLGLCISSSLFIGLVFLDAPLTIQGLQNQMFAIFELCSIFWATRRSANAALRYATLSLRDSRAPCQDILMEVFMLSEIVSEIPWNCLASVFMWAVFYYPVGLYKNADAAGQGVERAGLMWLLFWQFLLFMSTFTHMCISFAGAADEGGNVANFLFVLIFFFLRRVGYTRCHASLLGLSLSSIVLGFGRPVNWYCEC